MTRPAHLQLSSSSAFLDWFNHKDDDQDNDKATNWIALFTMHYKPSWSGIKDLTKKFPLPLQICPKYHIYHNSKMSLKKLPPRPSKKGLGECCLFLLFALLTILVHNTCVHLQSSEDFSTHAELLSFSCRVRGTTYGWSSLVIMQILQFLSHVEDLSFSYVEGFYMCLQLWTQQVATANEHFANEHFADEHSNCAYNLHRQLFFHIPPTPLTAEQTEKRLGTTYLPRSRV